MQQLKQQVFEANMDLPRYGLVTFTWGNVSAIDRQRGLVVIKPSGIAYESMTVDDMSVVDLQGHVVEGRWRPSSDTATHLALYRRYPDLNQVLQTSETELALRDTQTQFYALDMKHVGNDFKVDDGFNILKLRVKDAVEDQSLTYIASTFDPYDQVINDGVYENGRKLITFSSVLQHGVVPLPEILQMSMKYGAGAMRRPVEIEFACNINNDRSCEFYLLQIRPIVDAKEMLDEDVKAIPDSDCLLRSHNSLGHGISEDVVDVVYVKYDDHFSAMNNFYVADDIERINRKFLADGKNYVLIGPGRWGSSDHYLGVPVKWPHISAARVIVEVALKNYNIDPSQGTHFFQNLTSFGVGYFTVDTNTGEGGFVNKEILDAMPAVEETQYVRHVRFEHPMRILMDGKKQEGAVLIPKE